MPRDSLFDILEPVGVYWVMRIYGNSRTKMTGIIKKIQQKQALVQFPSVGREVPVPVWFIHTAFKEGPEPQELEIETWYLKKSRVLPLNEGTPQISRMF